MGDRLTATGKDKAKEAANAVIASPLLETSIAGAKRLLINIAMSEDILSSDVDIATKMITDKAADDVASSSSVLHSRRICRMRW